MAEQVLCLQSVYMMQCFFILLTYTPFGSRPVKLEIVSSMSFKRSKNQHYMDEDSLYGFVRHGKLFVAAQLNWFRISSSPTNAAR